MRFEFDAFGKKFVLHFGMKMYDKPQLYTIGVTNRTLDNRFLVFGDYDSANLKAVEDDAEMLQRRYGVGPVLVALSSVPNFNAYGDMYGNFHLIAFRKFDFDEAKKIISKLRCDEHFKDGWKYQGRCWVLRVKEKKKIKNNETMKPAVSFVSLLFKKPKGVCSAAHMSFYSRLLGFQFPGNVKSDRETGLELITYQTR
jgi:hypothetical protein